jgi:hypothetical protein
MLLSKAEELLLEQFHDLRGGRAGMPRELLVPSEAAAEEPGTDAPDTDFDDALRSLLARRLLRREGRRYALTEKGYEYLYTREAERGKEA